MTTIAFAGGGSGGHIYPIRALIQYCMQTKKPYILYRFGTSKSMEETICNELIHECQGSDISLKFIPIVSGKWRRQGRKELMANIVDLCLFGWGCIQCCWFFHQYHIQSVFCKGGFVALPVVIAAFLFRRRLVVHESDLSSGLVNSIASKFADTVFTGFDNVIPKSITIGQILSPDIFLEEKILADSLKSWINGRLCILVFGGSLGAKTIYDAIFLYLSKNMDDDRAWIVIGGELSPNDETRWTSISSVKFFSRCSQQHMGNIYLLADWAIMRAGTTSLAEAQVFGIQKVIIPLTITHDQAKNAQWYKKNYNDIVIDQHDDNWKQNLETVIDTIVKKKNSHSFYYHDNRNVVINALCDK